MTKGILGDREKALEDSYFRQQDAKLLQSLRKGAALDEIAVALSEKLQVDDPDLLIQAREAGITSETAAAFLIAPLVQIAWIDGSVSKPERSAALRLAVARGVDANSPAYSQLEAWLDVRPPDTLFEVALRVIQRALSVLPPKERDERIKRMVDACHEVAAASGSEVARLLGLGDGVSGAEESILDKIARSLRGF